MEDTDEKCLFVHGGNLLYFTCESAGHGQFAATVPCESCLADFVWQLFPENTDKKPSSGPSSGWWIAAVNRGACPQGDKWKDDGTRRLKGAAGRR